MHGEDILINNNIKPNKLIHALYPDLKQWTYSMVDDPEEVRIREGNLDIDLDYFYGYYYPQPEIGLWLSKTQIKRIQQLSLSQDKY